MSQPLSSSWIIPKKIEETKVFGSHKIKKYTDLKHKSIHVTEKFIKRTEKMSVAFDSHPRSLAVRVKGVLRANSSLSHELSTIEHKYTLFYLDLHSLKEGTIHLGLAIEDLKKIFFVGKVGEISVNRIEKCRNPLVSSSLVGIGKW
jgi:hypothetical protein